ncbi:hypothetical protein AgCh_028544 [Apium graveolens]
MTLKSEGCIVNGMRFDSCQLYQAHWTIRENDDVVSEIVEENVLGKGSITTVTFDNLRIHSYIPVREFVYQGCVPISTPQGSIKGCYTFVPGRLSEPKGTAFEVEVLQIFLKSFYQDPNYIF